MTKRKYSGVGLIVLSIVGFIMICIEKSAKIIEFIIQNEEKIGQSWFVLIIVLMIYHLGKKT